MQCTWPQLARLAFRGFARPSSTNLLTLHNRLSTRSISRLLSPEYVSFSSTLFLQQRRQYISVQTSLDAPSSATPPSNPNAASPLGPLLENAGNGLPSEELSEPTYSHAEIGRCAAQAVRALAQQGNLPDAYLIVQSLYYSQITGSAKGPQVCAERSLHALGIGKNHGDFIEFDKRVSPRFPAHALLHSLFRLGENDKVEQLVHEMTKTMRVRRRSLEVILKGFRDRSSSSPPTVFKPLNSTSSPWVTVLKPHMETDTNLTGHALGILQAARKSRGGSTRRMYRYLITLCIINGEIILASLIFGVLLRDWQAREKAKEAAATAAKSLLESSSSPAGLPELITEIPIPQVRDLRRICTFITWSFSTPETDESSMFAFTASLQALTNLAQHMDEGRLCLNFEPVITAMSKCPRTEEAVWIHKCGVLKNVQAYGYFHEVLDRLITSLPEREREQERQPQEAEINKERTLTPVESFNPFTYNALLHYALRNLHSLDHAEIVLKHMLPYLNNPEPSQITKTAKMSTLNILDRATKDYPPGVVESLMNDVGLCPALFDDLISAPEHELDAYALSTRIAILISLGQCNVVVEALPKILPGLFPPESPDGTPKLVAIRAAEKWREDGLSRAVSLGPVVFGALLHALRKDGRTGLAESVFLYGLEAEKRSFETNVSSLETTVIIRPWCLPIHVYTTMIQIYNDERLQAHEADQYAIGWGLTPEGIPLRHTMKDGKLVEPVKRNVLARQMIVQTYRSLMAAPDALAERISSLEALVEARQQGEIDGSLKGRPDLKLDLGEGMHVFVPPQADIWFFESLLDMFMKTPEDPLLPALAREMRKMGMKVRQNVENVVKNMWGPAVLEIPVDGINMKDRTRDPFGQQRDKRPEWKKAETSVPSRMGWKRWTTKEKQQGSIRCGTAWTHEDMDVRNEAIR